MDRLPTGIIGFDRLVAGGLPKGSMTLVLGNPGAGKTIFGQQFLYTGLAENEPCILVSTEPFERFRETASAFEWETSRLERTIFLDCYTYKTGVRSTQPNIVDISALANLTIAISGSLDRHRIAPNANTRLVLDSASEFMLEYGVDTFTKFLPSLKAKLEAAGITSLIMLEEEAHHKTALTTIEFITDATVRLKADQTGRYIMVSRMVGTPSRVAWIPFKILRGIELKAVQFFR